MQTFVPFTDNDMNAAALDSKRLNKQLLEGRQIYSILASGRRSGAWVNHPAVKMWRNFDMGLYVYLEAMYRECNNRGIKTEKNWEAITQIHDSNWNRGSKVVMPHWWGDNRVHSSHQYNLYNKDPEYYLTFADAIKYNCCDKCNYFWPVASHAKEYTPDPDWAYFK